MVLGHNQAWAKNAGALILPVAELEFSGVGKPNRHAYHDVGLAVGNLSAQATSMGLAVHQMGGFDQDKARKVFEIPDGFDPVSVIAVGFPGDSSTLEEPLREREQAARSRKDLGEFVFRTWSEPLGL